MPGRPSPGSSGRLRQGSLARDRRSSRSSELQTPAHDRICDPIAKELETMAARTVRLHRVLRAKPEKVYRAFLDAAAMAKWLPPYGFTCTVDHLDARVGGTFRMSFANFSTGQ